MTLSIPPVTAPAQQVGARRRLSLAALDVRQPASATHAARTLGLPAVRKKPITFDSAL
ncbi:hypothetical protein [Streptacidiphilus carbonis]|jgi:hypothetical protein|uniref:hypothetical protein n=1 Tax=Streptacidiphilus carbonis TaxID=105422 RepID=UPI0013770832|nr:hypothetical protein [Streptacidiphilus carbonis]